MSWISAARTRLHLLFARRATEARIAHEIAFHIEMETDRIMREERVPHEEARRRALATFGGVTRHTETLREGRGLAWLGGFSLDIKLGFRMLAKYPGLTVVGGLAMAFAICIGAVTFELVRLFLAPTLPLPGGDRIVQMRNWNTQTSRVESRATYDFFVWRDAMSTVKDVGAYVDETRNLIATDREVHRVAAAAITASAFRVASATPLLGRSLAPSDEEPGAPLVVVLGYDLWRTRFASDSSLVGRSVRLGDAFPTVVGVMREGFAFPVAHELWTPLRPDVRDRVPLAGPAVTIFGRLASASSLADAQAELAALGKRSASEHPDTHGYLHPQVAPFAKLFWEPAPSDRLLMASFNLFALLLLVLLSSNVALLMFARAATREMELIVRSALGARRARIIAQLVAEALVLGGVAATVGLAAAALGLRLWGREYLELNLGVLPFWFEFTVSPATVLYAAGLTLVGAVIAGAVPALKVTRGLGSRLKEGTAGAGGLRFGGVWTAVIVAQVAVTVAFPVIVYFMQRELRRIQSYDVGFTADEYVGMQLSLDAPTDARVDSAAERVRLTAATHALRERVEAEPGVAGVTFVDRLPRTYHRERYVEVDGIPASAVGADSSGQTSWPPEVATATIDPSYFDVLDAPMIAGRRFHAADLVGDARAVIVDQGFVDVVLRGGNAIGRRVRFTEFQGARDSLVDVPRPWYEIVGVAKDLGMAYMTYRRRVAGLYFPGTAGSAGPVNMIVHARGDPMVLVPKVRALAAAVDARVRLSDAQRLDRVADPVLWVLGVWLRVSAVLTAIALLLSLAGIYAVLSFTVARRTREIGVRVALGGTRAIVVAAIFRRPLTQVGAGVLVGGVLVGAITSIAAEQAVSFAQVASLVVYVLVMFGVCLLACVVPTRRALRVEPTQALRTE